MEKFEFYKPGFLKKPGLFLQKEQQMNRRQFIQFSGWAALTPFLPANIFSQSKTTPIVFETNGTEVAHIEAIFSALGGLGQMLTKSPERATVLIKPNLCLPHAAKIGTTTTPAAVLSLCQFLVKNKIKRIIIADHTLQKTANFANHEFHRLAEKFPQVKMIFANDQRFFKPVTVPGKVLKKTETLKLLGRADFVINFATAKHHSATQVSLAVKNLMGLVWNRTEFHTQLHLHQAIGDLTLAIKPRLNLIDASRVLLNGGPTGPGPIIEENKLFASQDIVAVDATVVSRYNFGGRSLAPGEILHLVAAHKNGAGEIDPEKIRVERLKVS